MLSELGYLARSPTSGLNDAAGLLKDSSVVVPNLKSAANLMVTGHVQNLDVNMQGTHIYLLWYFSHFWTDFSQASFIFIWSMIMHQFEWLFQS